MTTLQQRRNDEVVALKRELSLHVKLLGGFVAVFWLVHLVSAIGFGGRLVVYGIRPRTLSGLWGLLTMPFLHGNLPHLIGNTVPFVVLGWLVLARSVARFVLVTLLGMGLGGLGVWLVGASNSVHVGASGLVFTYFGHTLLAGWFERRVGSIVLSVLVFFLYGALILGVLPGQCGVSWEGHLFGFAAGAASAWLTSGRAPVGHRARVRAAQSAR